MTWSIRNYRAYALLGEGNLFVSMHMILNHALCTLQQAHLPQGDAWLTSSAPNFQTTWNEEIAATCSHHAKTITDIASSLYRGDDTDRESLRSPFSGAAIVSAATVLLWSLHASQTGHAPLTAASERLKILLEILRSWQKSWLIAGSWIETVEILSLLYAVAYGKAAGDDLSQIIAANTNPCDSTSTFGAEPDVSGLPEPSSVSPRLFEKIRHIMFTIAEPTARKQLQTQLHIRDLWNHMCLQAQMTSLYPVDFGDNDASNHGIHDTPEVPFGWGEYLPMLHGDSSINIDSEPFPTFEELGP